MLTIALHYMMSIWIQFSVALSVNLINNMRSKYFEIGLPRFTKSQLTGKPG